jgi:hypothetical protein
MRVKIVQRLLSACALFVALGLHARAAHAQTPLDEAGDDYLDMFPLGLYPGGNRMPAEHHQEGLSAAQAITPRALDGSADDSGHVVFLAIGGDDAADTFCTAAPTSPPMRNNENLLCENESVLGRVGQHGRRVESLNPSTYLLNAAFPGQYAAAWEDDSGPPFMPDVGGAAINGNYSRVGAWVLSTFASEAQVQVAWVKLWNAEPTRALPAEDADAYVLVERLGNVLRFMKARYPNLQVVLLTSREYGGYATGTLNPEPYAYETGFAVKWLIEAQIAQMENGGEVQDARAGDLNYQSGVAPWIAWGPYTWSNGSKGRERGPSWVQADFEPSAPSLGTFFSVNGQSKASLSLLHHLTLSPFAKCWLMSVAECK